MRTLFILLFIFISTLLHAQRDLEVSSANQKRIALVIGNGAYQYTSQLSNTLYDADAMAKALSEVGFDVIKVKDADFRTLKNKLDEFTTRIEAGRYPVALCFYSGHGLQVNGENFLVPIDANPLRESDVEFECLNAQRIVNRMEDARASTKIVLLDACRNNPLPKSWGKSTGSNGLAYMNAPAGTFIGFATSPGTVAWDGAGANSPYTTAILTHLRTPGLDIHQVFTRVSKSTRELAANEGKTQVPFINSSLPDDFYFVVGGGSMPPVSSPTSSSTSKPSTTNSMSTIPETIADATVGTFVKVKGGSFDMGGTEFNWEKPIHRVTLSDYYIGQTEVTQAQWKAVMGNNPSSFSGCDECPVENVSWDDIQIFLQKLNSRSGGAKYRLPTEAEWEYAARGGASSNSYTYAGSNNIDDVAWYDGNSGNKTHPVKGKQANELGLSDMSGNVNEWCSNWYGSYSSGSQTNPSGPSSGSYRVYRGCSLGDEPQNCRVSQRSYTVPTFRYFYLGFRLARSVSF